MKPITIALTEHVIPPAVLESIVDEVNIMITEIVSLATGDGNFTDFFDQPFAKTLEVWLAEEATLGRLVDGEGVTSLHTIITDVGKVIIKSIIERRNWFMYLYRHTASNKYVSLGNSCTMLTLTTDGVAYEITTDIDSDDLTDRMTVLADWVIRFIF